LLVSKAGLSIEPGFNERHTMDGTTGAAPSTIRNDVHSGLNPSRHARVCIPHDATQIAETLHAAAKAGQCVAIAGAQHAMGGQQFADGGWLLDTRALDGIIDFDPVSGHVCVGAGTRWPTLQRFLETQRDPQGRGWAIRQKQTGADDFSLGGALAANIHGRGLDRPPFVDDIESFTLVTPDSGIVEVDRQRQPELFSLAVGGYGLFGVVSALTLRLAPRRIMQRRVCLLRRAELAAAFAQARAEGARYGDFQFAIDPRSGDFLDLGVFACYVPVDGRMDGHTAASAATHSQTLQLSSEDWRELLMLAHIDKSEAFRRYSAFYLASDGQLYGGDDHQFGVYLDGYHRKIDAALGHIGSEVITELYVPLDDLDAFLGLIADDCRRHDVDLIYGTVRVIERDRETVLAWARQPWACIVLNLHVNHDADGRSRMRDDMRRLIDRALQFGGSFYLTYHRSARAEQLQAAYPRLDEWLAAKRRIDPAGVLASDWYRALLATLGTPSDSR
jgi:FAD/FMN-containing dehydrogenase